MSKVCDFFLSFLDLLLFLGLSLLILCMNVFLDIDLLLVFVSDASKLKDKIMH